MFFWPENPDLITMQQICFQQNRAVCKDSHFINRLKDIKRKTWGVRWENLRFERNN